MRCVRGTCISLAHDLRDNFTRRGMAFRRRAFIMDVAVALSINGAESEAIGKEIDSAPELFVYCFHQQFLTAITFPQGNDRDTRMARHTEEVSMVRTPSDCHVDRRCNCCSALLARSEGDAIVIRRGRLDAVITACDAIAVTCYRCRWLNVMRR